MSFLRHFLLLLILGLPLQASAEIYTWTDAMGRTHFTDTPPPTTPSRKIEISPLNTYLPPSADSIKTILARPTATLNKAKVIVYSTTWCGVCKKVKRWLRQNQIAFREYDVEKSSRGRRDYKRMNGRGVPIIKIGKQRLNGFSAAGMTNALRKAGYKM